MYELYLEIPNSGVPVVQQIDDIVQAAEQHQDIYLFASAWSTRAYIMPVEG